MSIVDEYLEDINKALKANDPNEIRNLAQEIHGAFAGIIDKIDAYTRDEHGATELGLKQLRGKLELYRNECDRELYGRQGLETITDHIRFLEKALDDGLQGEELKAVYIRVDSIYANYYDSYVDGLSGYSYSQYNPCDEQTVLRIEKLKHFRGEELRKMKIAEVRASNVSMIQSNSQSSNAVATANVQVTQEVAFEQIDNIPGASLSEADKTLLKGMIAELQTKDDGKRESRLKKLQSWLADKGTDVFIAAMPYIVQLIQSQLGK